MTTDKNINLIVRWFDAVNIGDISLLDLLADELLMKNKASGEWVSVQLLAITRFAGGQIAEEWQLGVPGRW
jgi:hypothetical protein